MSCDKGITLSFWLNIRRVFSKQKLIVQLWDQQNSRALEKENSNHQVGLLMSVTKKSALTFLDVELVTPLFEVWRCQIQVTETSMVTFTWQRDENLKVYINKTLIAVADKLLTPSVEGDSAVTKRQGRYVGQSNIVDLRDVMFWEDALSNVDVEVLYNDMLEESADQQLQVESKYQGRI